jgi:rod shape-determining protein MreC
VQNGARAQARLDPLTHSVQTLAIPIARPAGGLAVGTGEFFYGLTRARRLAVENKRLYDRLVANALYVEQSSRLQREIDNLRGLLSLPDLPGRARIPADIIGFVPRDNRLTLSVGTKQGIKAGMPVVGAAGLIGTVQTVAADRCGVLLLTSRGLTLGAIVLDRNPAPAGLLRGEDSDTLILTLRDPKAPVQIGDTVATSGLSEVVPRGIPIGRVIQVEDDIAFGERRAIIDPFASVGELREVVVLK